MMVTLATSQNRPPQKRKEKKRKEMKQPNGCRREDCRGYNGTDFFMMVKYLSGKELVWANLIEL
jgi:hypothetical protein